MVCNILFQWDDEARVWIATSKDIPGLVLEGGSFDALIERVRIAIPELLELNGNINQDIRLTYSAQREDRLAVYG